MRPDQQFSDNHGPVWTPQVWRDGPELLVRQAQQALFGDRAEIEHGALDTHDRAISGADTGTQNESDIIHSVGADGQQARGSTTPDGRSAVWSHVMHEMFATEPRLAGWSSGDRTGPVNPAP